MSYFFFLYQSLSSSLCTIFESISYSIDEVLSINPSANVFVFGKINIHHSHPTGLPILVKLIYLLAIIISNDLTQMVNFPTCIPDCDSHSPALLVYLFLLILVFALQRLFLHWEILIMLLSQFPLTFRHIHNGMPCFIALLMINFMLIGTVFMII